MMIKKPAFFAFFLALLALPLLMSASAPAQAAQTGKHATASKPAAKTKATTAKTTSKKAPTKKKTTAKGAQKPKAAPTALAAAYAPAFAALAANNPQQAEAAAARGSDPILNKVIRGYAMALPGNDYSFEQLDGFLRTNPRWPTLKGIQMIAEQKVPPTYTAHQTVAWYTEHPPITLVGFYRFVDALNETGRAQSALSAIRLRWITDDMSGDETAAFYARFGSLLDGNATWAKVDRLLWKNDAASARRLLPYLTGTDQAVARARLALASQEGDAETWLSQVPPDARNDPGLIYQKLRWLVKRNRDSEAEDILLNPPDDLGNPDPWWDQRNIMIRRAIERHDFVDAYRLAAAHGQTKARPVVDAEFMAGWLALRFLNRPDLARQHFQEVFESGSAPITRARASYWLGRTAETMGDRNGAEQAYEDASVFNTTFYGQLASARIFANPDLKAKSDPPFPDSARKSMMSRDWLQAIIRLHEAGETDRARSFFRSIADSATERGEYVLLTEIAARMKRPDLGIQAVKAAAQKKIILYNGGFPLITMAIPQPPEPAFTHAVIRQESLFNPEAGSPVGARGLMQLMPGTARDTAKRIGLKYKDSMIAEPETNLRLGTTFLQQQIDRYNGSYILALAAYNAGPGRVREWIATFGDPRSPDVDPVDWIELMPMSETRNYVQRIMENLQIYRAKLAGGHAPLMLTSDLKR